MFVQVIQGRTSDAAGVRHMLDRWVDELSPGAPGWLGSTMGVTADGQFIGIARFGSAEDARRNSARAEQGAWWEEFAKHLDGEATFHDCDDATTFLAGGADDAGFVQFIISRVADRAKLEGAQAAMATMEADDFGRSDLIGGVMALHSDDDGLTQVAYFTSEAEARRGEAQPPPAHVQEAMAQWEGATTDTRYLDLTHPWTFSPRSS